MLVDTHLLCGMNAWCFQDFENKFNLKNYYFKLKKISFHEEGNPLTNCLQFRLNQIKLDWT